VFCGSRKGRGTTYEELAQDLGRAVAEAGHSLVYGGGSIGLMGIVANAVLSGGGDAVGVMPERLTEMEVGHKYLGRLEVVPDMLSRKQRMIELADGFITLPGGLGTLDELFEILTWTQLGLIDKPMVLLDRDDYFRGLRHWLDQAVGEAFMDSAHRDRLLIARDPDEAVRLASNRTKR
jgi:uncharacterized protein (TIGR00730 family)